MCLRTSSRVTQSDKYCIEVGDRDLARCRQRVLTLSQKVLCVATWVNWSWWVLPWPVDYQWQLPRVSSDTEHAGAIGRPAALADWRQPDFVCEMVLTIQTGPSIAAIAAVRICVSDHCQEFVKDACLPAIAREFPRNAPLPSAPPSGV